VDPKDGKYSTLGKERTIPRALQAIGNHLAEKYADTKVWVSVMHGQSPEYADSLAQLLRGALQISKLEILRISPVLGVHTGPGIIGAAVVPMALMENLD
jgi:fatty acid-binding protein DegV